MADCDDLAVSSKLVLNWKIQKFCVILVWLSESFWINIRKVVHNIMFVQSSHLNLIQEKMPRIASSIKSWNPGTLWFLQSDWFISQNLRFCGIRDTAACRQFVQLSICYWNPRLNRGIRDKCRNLPILHGYRYGRGIRDIERTMLRFEQIRLACAL